MTLATARRAIQKSIGRPGLARLPSHELLGQAGAGLATHGRDDLCRGQGALHRARVSRGQQSIDPVESMIVAEGVVTPGTHIPTPRPVIGSVSNQF